MARFFSAVLLLLATITQYSYCSVMSCRGGCFLSRTFFGGRLLFTSRNGVGSGSRPSWIGPKSKIIFQTPRGLQSVRRSLHNSIFGHGRGKVWMGKRIKCSSSDAESDFCPKTQTENYPCLETTLPCEPDACKVDLKIETESRLRGRARLIAVWSNLPETCDFPQQSITLEQIDWDGGCDTTASMSKPRTFYMENGQKNKSMLNLPAYSTFKVSLRVTSLSGVYITTKTVKTVETHPTAAPSNVTMTTTGQFCIFRWKAPPCGTHHGEITKYGFQIWKSNESRVPYHTHNLFAVYHKNMLNGRYNFRVCAYNSKGNGPFSNIIPVDL